MVLYKKNCLHCCFCTKKLRLENGAEHTFSLNKLERDVAQKKNYNFLRNQIPEWLECYKGQWSESYKLSGSSFTRDSLGKKRCTFFYPFSKGEDKFLEAVEKEQEADRIKRAEKVAAWSFLIATLSFVSQLIPWKQYLLFWPALN